MNSYYYIICISIIFIYFISEKPILGAAEKSRVGAQAFYNILQYKDKIT